MKLQQHRAMEFLKAIEEGVLPVARDTVPLADKDIMAVCAAYLDHGNISARRLAQAFDATFEAMNESFRFHNINYSIGL